MTKADQIMLTFCPYPRVEVSGSGDEQFQVSFIDGDTERIVYKTTLKPGHWAEPGPKYYVAWHIVVEQDGLRVIDYRLDLRDKRVLIVLNSTALGDTLAWMPCAEQFQRKHGCKVICQTHWNQLFKPAYPELEFEEPKSALSKRDYFCAYVVGCFDADYNRNKNNWRAVPLQQIASDFLGLDYHCQRPRIARSSALRPVQGRYVAISEFANGYLAKQWLYPGGWQKLVDYLIGQGYEVVSVSKEPSALERVTRLNGRSIEETVNNIQHADFFVGCSSGPSILAWALGVPTVVISGFTETWGEVEDVQRVSPPSGICSGCINDPTAPLDRANFTFCPRGQHMICSRSITPEAVIEAVSRLVSEPQNKPERVLLVLPHCSTGGMPQYALKQAQDLRAAGFEVAAIEWQNLSDDYVVQRRHFQKLLGPRYHIVNEDGQRLMDIVNNFQPAVLHLHQAPELMLPEQVANHLFTRPRNYRIVETLHTADFGPEQTTYWPDAYSFVSRFHASRFAHACEERAISFSVVEYRLPKRVRPDRTEALQRLGLDPNRSHVLNVGLFTPDKNQAELWDMARRLPQVQFHVVGNQATNFRDYWLPLMQGKPANVRVWGEREDVNKFYSAMDALFFPSRKELFPLVVKEALSWQMPVLMRDLPAYCGAYDCEPLVTYVNGNPAETAQTILERTGSMSQPLTCM